MILKVLWLVESNKVRAWLSEDSEGWTRSAFTWKVVGSLFFTNKSGGMARMVPQRMVSRKASTKAVLHATVIPSRMMEVSALLTVRHCQGNDGHGGDDM